VLDAPQKPIEVAAIGEKLVERRLRRIGLAGFHALDTRSHALGERSVDHTPVLELGKCRRMLLGCGVLVDQIAYEVRRAAQSLCAAPDILGRSTRTKSAQLLA
jgi:hypothetical protein